MKKIVSAILALFLVSSISLCAFALPSRRATVKKVYEGGTATYTYDPDTGNITVTFDLKKGYKFIGWTINGDYEIVSGKLTSTTIVIRPKKDIEIDDLSEGATPKFKKLASAEKTTKKSSGGSGSTSPKTSDNGMAIPMLALLALGGVIVSTKKLSK
ncbi:MAG: hypothetical protein IJO19_01605 [Clostridia bacterium]|nr:hypothetical protein [Clostridia bacterium]